MSQMIKCQHCGTFVPTEKAFCPNCSEPMEVEEKSNRNHSFSSDMMSTIRDDPEKYRELLNMLPGKKKPQQTPQPQPQPTPSPVQGNTPPPLDANARQSSVPAAAPPVMGYNQQQAAPPVPTLPSNSKRGLILGISAVALLAIVIVLLFVFKVI